MNILELDTYNLADAVKFNDQLNPRLWGKDRNLKPDVREHLLQIADDFREFLGVSGYELKDITVSGSNAAYTYTPNSDIDLHLVVDLPQADANEVYRELFDAKKFQYNEQHNISIGGYPVELYVQDANKKHISQGIYSVLNNTWIDIPKRKDTGVDDISTRSKYEDLATRIDTAVKSNDYDSMANLMEKIKTMRQTGLDEHGEFGPENLAFKMLRNQGSIKKLVDARNAAKDRELSLKEREKVKPRVTYGFNTEDATATWDGVSATTQMFLNEKPEPSVSEIVSSFIEYCIEQLSIEQTPIVKFKKDPQWSARNKTFGRYNADQNLLEVSLADRHVMDILRTVAHELAHTRQHEVENVPDDAGATGSKWENEANARAGVLMREYAQKHPEFFEAGEVDEGAKASTGKVVKSNNLLSRDPQLAAVQKFANVHYRTTDDDADALNKFFQRGLQHSKENDDIQSKQIRKLEKKVADLEQTVNGDEIDEGLKDKIAGAALAACVAGAPGCATTNPVNTGAEAVKAAVRTSQISKDDLKYGVKQGLKNILRRAANANESSGYIPTKKQAKDPRFAMALTKDVKPGATGKEANKLGLHTDSQGHPGLLMTGLANALREFKEAKPLDKATPTLLDIAKKHKVEIDTLKKQLEKGVKVELEHTSDHAVAKEIALDHLSEFPDYYTRLDRVEVKEESLFEINMSPSNLQKLAADISARAGMEFEMIVPDVAGGDDDDYPEPDYDSNESTGSFQSIREFFLGEYNSRREVDSVISKLEEEFYEWWDEHSFERWQDENYEYMYEWATRNVSDDDIGEELELEPGDGGEYEIGKEEYKKFAQKCLDDQNGFYDDALQDFRDNNMDSGDGVETWLEEVYPTMRDINENFDVQWPHYTSSEGNNSIEEVAGDFEVAIGKTTHWSSNYHSGKREPDAYTVEPDGSLDADNSSDSGLEFISPPMSISEMFDDLDQVAKWAAKRGCYTNYSTGLHMNISIPGWTGEMEKLDYVKLALLMGDEYVLNSFGRMSNTYAKSALKIVRDRAAQRPEDIAALLKQMREHLSAAASKVIHSGVTSKYTSVNIKEGYIEFRSPGGDWLGEYAADAGKIKNTLLRFVVAMDAAVDPEKYREEYLKKLYKMLGVLGAKNKDTISYFADFVAGKLPKAALKSFIKQAQLERKGLKDLDNELSSFRVGAPQEAFPYTMTADGPGPWEIYRISDNSSVRDIGHTNRAEAEAEARSACGMRWCSELYGIRTRRGGFTGDLNLFPDLPRPQADADEPAVQQPIAAPRRGEFTGQWIIKDPEGREIHRFGGIGNQQSDANRIAMQWLRQNPGQLMSGVEVVPEMR